jgi:hypothetical protein
VNAVCGKTACTVWAADGGQNPNLMRHLRPDSCEAAEQRRATFGGGCGGRAQTEENIVESCMHPAQSGKRMSPGIGRCAKSYKEAGMIHRFAPPSDIELFRDSFYALQHRTSPGVDGMKWQEYEAGLEDRFIDLHNRAHRGAAKPQDKSSSRRLTDGNVCWASRRWRP